MKTETKEVAREDARRKVWNPAQFSTEADRLEYANAWEWFTRMAYPIH